MRGIFTVIAIAALASGCAVSTEQAQSGEAVDETSATAQTKQALVAGNWQNQWASGVMTGSGGQVGNLPICRASYDSGQHPGKVWMAGGRPQCHFGWGGEEKTLPNYEVLVNSGYHWENPGRNVCWGYYCSWSVSMPDNAVEGGSAGTASGYERMGVCEANYAGSWHPGKFWRNKCLFGYAGQEKTMAPDLQGNVLILVK